MAAGVAAWLSRAAPLPGSAPLADVVGALRALGTDKADAAGFFTYSVLLVPLFAAGFAAVAARLSQSLERGLTFGAAGLGGLWLAAAAAAAALPVFAALADQRRDALRCVILPLAAVLAGLAGAALVRALGSAPARAAFAELRARATGAASIACAGASLAVFALAVGPPVDPGLGLRAAALRTGGAVLLGIAGALGLALLLQAALALPRGLGRAPLVAPGARRALLHLSWLLVARLAPDQPLAVYGALALAVLGAALTAFREQHRPAAAALSLERPLRRACLAIQLPALVVALVFQRDVNGAIDLFHSGEWLTPGAALLEGSVPYRDLYLQHGFVQNALRSGLTLFAFGDTLAADRLSLAFVFALAHAALLVLLFTALRSRALALLLALMLATPPLFVSPRFLGFYLALACALRDLDRARGEDGRALPRGSLAAIAAAGLGTSLALFWSVDSGLYAGAAILALLALDGAARRAPARERLRPLFAYLGGALAGAAPFVVAFAATGALIPWLENGRDQLLLQLSVWGLPYPTQAELAAALAAPGGLADGRVLGTFSGVVFVLALALLAVRALSGSFSKTCWRMLLLALAGTALFRSALGRSDAGHLAYSAALLWPILALAAESIARRPPRFARAAALTALLRALPVAAFLGWLIGAYAPLYGMARQWLRLAERPAAVGDGQTATVPLRRAAGVLVPREQAQALASVALLVDARLGPDETFFEFSNMGALYFLLERRCPTRFAQPVYAATPELQQSLVADLEASRPRLVLISPLLGFDPVDGIPMAERLPLVAEYLAARYRLAEERPYASVYQRSQ